MTRTAIREYAEAVRGRYLRGTKEEKGKILDEFTKATGLHRKAAIRLIRRSKPTRIGKRRGRPRQYGTQLVGMLRVIWEATDRLCSKRLHPFIPEMLMVFRRHGESTVSAEVETPLCQMSPSTIDRVLRPWRRLGGRSRLSETVSSRESR